MNKRSLKLGDSVALRTQVTSQMVSEFAHLSGDHNPLHLDQDFAARTRFGRCIVHGLLLASFYSKLLAEDLPGPGTIYLSQSLHFLRPVFVDSMVTTSVELVSIETAEGKAELRCSTTLDSGKEAVSGVAVVLYR